VDLHDINMALPVTFHPIIRERFVRISESATILVSIAQGSSRLVVPLPIRQCTRRPFILRDISRREASRNHRATDRSVAYGAMNIAMIELYVRLVRRIVLPSRDMASSLRWLHGPKPICLCAGQFPFRSVEGSRVAQSLR